jgi:thymidylate synthase
MIRVPYDFPTLTITKKSNNIDDYNVDDFNVRGYQSHDTIKMDIRG